MVPNPFNTLLFHLASVESWVFTFWIADTPVFQQQCRYPLDKVHVDADGFWRSCQVSLDLVECLGFVMCQVSLLLFVKGLDFVECCFKPGRPYEIDHLWDCWREWNWSFP